jgi:hypothetical protein
MKPRKFVADRHEDVRDDDRYAFLFRKIAGYLSDYMDLDCRALVLIAVTDDGHVSIMNGGRSIDFDYNGMLRELVETEVDLNRPAEGGVN